MAEVPVASRSAMEGRTPLKGGCSLKRGVLWRVTLEAWLTCPPLKSVQEQS